MTAALRNPSESDMRPAGANTDKVKVAHEKALDAI